MHCYTNKERSYLHFGSLSESSSCMKNHLTKLTLKSLNFTVLCNRHTSIWKGEPGIWSSPHFTYKMYWPGSVSLYDTPYCRSP